MLNRPAYLAISDVWIARVVELKRQGRIGRWTHNVLGLLDIRQRMGVCARSCKARSASGGGGGRITDLPSSGKRCQSKGAKQSRALSPTGKHPDAFNRRAWSGI